VLIQRVKLILMKEVYEDRDKGRGARAGGKRGMRWGVTNVE
jgi:hypothetical protein